MLDNLVFPSNLNKTSEQQNNLKEMFIDFVITHLRHYKDQEEYQKRFEIFLANYDKIEKLNAEAARNGRNTTFSSNQFSDLDSSENRGHMSEQPVSAANMSDADFEKRIENNLEKS